MRSMRSSDRLVLVAGLLGAGLLAAGWAGQGWPWGSPALLAAAEPPGPQRWEAQIRAFEAEDRTNPPAPGGVLFVGSSSIVRWPLEQSFPDLPLIKRGFGGSQVADTLYFAERIILPYKPRVVVVYAGDNDIAVGKTAEQVRADYRALTAKILAALPRTRIVFISIKPSLKRWALFEKMQAANRLIEADCARDERLVYLDVVGPMLGPDGKPRAELLAADELHLSDEGYALWTRLLRPYLGSGQ